MDCIIIGTFIKHEPDYDYHKTKRGGGAVPANGLVDTNTIGSGEQCHLQRYITNNDYDDINIGRENIVCYGFIKYDTVFSRVFTRGFGVIYIPNSNYFTTGQMPSYNYD